MRGRYPWAGGGSRAEMELADVQRYGHDETRMGTRIKKTRMANSTGRQRIPAFFC